MLWVFGPAVVLGVAAYIYLTAGRYVSTDNAYLQADHATIAPQIGGRVVEVLVHENQPVKAGDVLFRIDPQPLKIALARSEAQVEVVRSLLNAGRAGYRSAQADLRSAEEALRVNERQYQRMKDMRARGLIAQKELDDAANNYADARGKRDSDAAALAKAQSMLGGLPDTPNEDLAGYRFAMAQLDQAKLDVEHATVRAPIDGVVGKVTLQPGDFLATGQAAMPLVATHNLWVDANFKETDLTHVGIGQAGDDRGRHLSRPQVEGARRLDQPGVRRRVFAAAGAERHRQLGQDRAAHSGAAGDRRAGRGSGTARRHERGRGDRHRQAELAARPAGGREAARAGHAGRGKPLTRPDF